MDNTDRQTMDNDYASIGEMKTMGETPTTKPGRFRVGDAILGRYTVIGELGQGGMGVVYKCLDTVGGIEVALKALPPELSHNTLEMEDIRENFQLVSRLSHPNIASIKTLERDPETGDCYLLMECVNGENLRGWLKRKRRDASVAGVGDPGMGRPQRGHLQGSALPLADALPVLRQVASALDYAHEKKIVHRDVKPGNVMLEADGTAKVLDFGLAAEIHTSMSRVSMAYRGTSGTGPYMAPEQWRGRRQGAAADQYALAVMAYEMLAGKLPFENVDISVLREAVLNEAPDTIPGLPPAAMSALLRALAKEASERFSSCGEFVAALGGGKISTRRRGARGVGYWVLGLGASVALAFAARVSYSSYWSHRSHVVQDAATQAQAAELGRAADAALVSGDLAAAGAKIAELAALPGGAASASSLRTRYESLAGERETNKRYADASLAHDRAMKLDPGQTLGTRQEALERSWREAEAARQGKSWGQALSAYDAVIAQTAELVRMDGSREDAKTRRLAAEQAKQSSEESKADAYAKDLYAEGGRAASRAAESFEKGDFAGAAKFWEEAAADYAKAKSRSLAVQDYNKAQSAYESAVASDHALLKAHGGTRWNEVDRQARLGGASANDPATGADAYGKALAGLAAAVTEAKAAEKAARLDAALAEARAAKTREDWPAVVAAADKALGVDGGNYEAMNLKSTAEGNLVPQWRLVATVDGREVPATATVGGKTYTLPQTLTLEGGGLYSAEVAYESGGRRYAADAFSVTADWKGVKERRIALEERKEPRPGEPRTVDLASGVKLELVWCPAGSFTMGSPITESGRDDDETQHAVALTKGFWMGKYEVTQRQWEAVMGSTPSYFKNAGPDAPVESVSWDECQEFIRKVNAQVPGGGFRLPTEAEWEYACRARTTTAIYTGALTILGANNGPELDDVAWYGGNSGVTYAGGYDSSGWPEKQYNHSRAGTHPVGQKRANAWGMHDMHGNVWEWCSDWYGGYPSGSVTDPAGPGSGSFRVYRGGSWGSDARYCRSAIRNWRDPGLSRSNLGLRLARSPQ